VRQVGHLRRKNVVSTDNDDLQYGSISVSVLCRNRTKQNKTEHNKHPFFFDPTDNTYINQC